MTTQVDFLGDTPINHTLIAVAQEVAESLKQAYPVKLTASSTLKQLRFARSSQNTGKSLMMENVRRHLHHRQRQPFTSRVFKSNSERSSSCSQLQFKTHDSSD